MLEKCHHFQGFPQAVYTWGDLLPPDMGGGQSINGGLIRGDTDVMGGGGDLTLIDYIIN